jgi:DNA-directed RNA polymerase specialized sigma24 family protein
VTLKQPFETVVAVHGSIPTGELPETTAVPGAERDPDLADALARLPGKQKQAVAYHYLAGLPYIDVAAILGGSTDAARRSSRAE